MKRLINLLFSTILLAQSPVVPISDMMKRTHGIADFDQNGIYSEADRFFIAFDNNNDGRSDLIYIHKIYDFKVTDSTYSFNLDNTSQDVWIDLDYDGKIDMATGEHVDNTNLINYIFGRPLIKPEKKKIIPKENRI